MATRIEVILRLNFSVHFHFVCYLWILSFPAIEESLAVVSFGRLSESEAQSRRRRRHLQLQVLKCTKNFVLRIVLCCYVNSITCLSSNLPVIPPPSTDNTYMA